MSRLRVIHAGVLPYAEGYRLQCLHVEEVLAARETGAPEVGRVLLLEHPPVITVSRRAGAANHLIATPEELARRGVEVAETDRGGDITYHGPGQLVAYPILDLSLLNLGLHAYMRMLEAVVIAVCARFGVTGSRDATATGVWVANEPKAAASKIAAMGVRVRKWVSMHGLALNVETDLSHFDLIVPCGLAGRSVTSLRRELGDGCPSMAQVRETLAEELDRAIAAAAAEASARRAAQATPA